MLHVNHSSTKWWFSPHYSAVLHTLVGCHLVKRGQESFFLCSLIKKSTFGCTVYLPLWHELFTSLLQHHQMLKMPDLLVIFLTLPQIFRLGTSPPQRKTTKTKIQVSQLNKCIDLLWNTHLHCFSWSCFKLSWGSFRLFKIPAAL